MFPFKFARRSEIRTQPGQQEGNLGLGRGGGSGDGVGVEWG